jgi:hypothetical protein
MGCKIRVASMGQHENFTSPVRSAWFTHPIMIGIPLGILIGLLSGVIFIFLVRTAWMSRDDGKALAKVILELVAIPTFWFGGSWAASTFLREIDVSSMLPYYATSLAVVFGLFAVPVLYKIIVQIAREVGQKSGGTP